MHQVKEELIEKIKNKTAVVGLIGLGYVGLPLAVEKAKAGFKVIGIDVNAERVDQLRAGTNYIGDVDDHELAQVVADHSFEADTDYHRIAEMDVIVIAVPTSLNKNLSPDLHYVEDATNGIAAHLRAGQFISLESTTYPGTTEEIMLPILEGSGLTVEKDYFLAHSPERVDPGNSRFKTKNTPKVVGGVGPDSQEVAVIFYQQTLDHIVPVSSAQVAELSKVFENTFRAVNIGLANEMMLLCDRMNLDIWEVLDAAFTKPFGIMPFYPGPGVGGHCIPIDPHYLEWKANEYNFKTRFIELAGSINRFMPEFVCQKAGRVLNRQGKSLSHSKILVLGVTYKPDVSDMRESPALPIIDLLQSSGANVVFHDPFVSEFQLKNKIVHGEALTDELIQTSDLVLVVTAHKSIDYGNVLKKAQQILDTRNVMRPFDDGDHKITFL